MVMICSLRWTVTLVVLLLLSSCGTFRTVTGRLADGTADVLGLGRDEATEAENKAPEPVELPIGKVHFVHPKGEFVLVKSGVVVQMTPNSRLEGRTLGRKTSDLALSPERRSGFLVADVLTGRPEVGDAVFYIREAIVGEAPPEEGHFSGERLVPSISAQ